MKKMNGMHFGNFSVVIFLLNFLTFRIMALLIVFATVLLLAIALKMYLTHGGER